MIIPFYLYGQDTTKNSFVISSHSEKPKGHFHSPKKATIFSACLPGLGQAYNKKYWKIPVIYAGIGATVYFITDNNKSYKKYKQAYINKTDNDPNTIDTEPNYNEAGLRELQNNYRRWRDLNIILTGLFYTMNIIDAYVDAQLITFDVSDNLSMNVFPSMNFYSQNKNSLATLTITLRF
ncbi:MAG: DUF5683 domain-containing protein [Bacteroidota bacterium]